jgi:hypothetical protein
MEDLTVHHAELQQHTGIGMFAPVVVICQEAGGRQGDLCTRKKFRKKSGLPARDWSEAPLAPSSRPVSTVCDFLASLL